MPVDGDGAHWDHRVDADRGQQIAAIAFAILGNDSCGFGVGEVLDPLLLSSRRADADGRQSGRHAHQPG
jgi:hypothetical protein